MIERLVRAVDAIASARDAESVHAVAGDLADGLLLVSDCMQLTLADDDRAALNALGAAVERMERGAAGAEALGEARRLARLAQARFHAGQS
jgi:hypothetical protein